VFVYWFLGGKDSAKEWKKQINREEKLLLLQQVVT